MTSVTPPDSPVPLFHGAVDPHVRGPVELDVDEARLARVVDGVGVGELEVVHPPAVVAAVHEGGLDPRPVDGEVLAGAELAADEEVDLAALPVVVVGVEGTRLATLQGRESYIGSFKISYPAWCCINFISRIC